MDTPEDLLKVLIQSGHWITAVALLIFGWVAKHYTTLSEAKIQAEREVTKISRDAQFDKMEAHINDLHKDSTHSLEEIKVLMEHIDKRVSKLEERPCHKQNIC
jgi:hypothetical protein